MEETIKELVECVISLAREVAELTEAEVEQRSKEQEQRETRE